MTSRVTLPVTSRRRRRLRVVGGGVEDGAAVRQVPVVLDAGAAELLPREALRRTLLELHLGEGARLHHALRDGRDALRDMDNRHCCNGRRKLCAREWHAHTTCVVSNAVRKIKHAQNFDTEGFEKTAECKKETPQLR